MTDLQMLPVLFSDNWLVKLAEGWRLKDIATAEIWGAQWVVVMYREVPA